MEAVNSKKCPAAVVQLELFQTSREANNQEAAGGSLAPDEAKPARKAAEHSESERYQAYRAGAGDCQTHPEKRSAQLTDGSLSSGAGPDFATDPDVRASVPAAAEASIGVR